MLPYFLLLALLMFFLGGSRLINGDLGVQKISVFIAAIFLIIFQGFRSIHVGTDTGTYVQIFESVVSISDIWKTTEIGYSTVNVITSLLFDSYTPLLLAIATIVIIFYIAGIFKMNDHYGLALFLFVTLGTYTFSFNGARQGIAAAICFLALHFLLQRRAAPYFFLIFLAALFHHTAIITAPLYILAQKKFQWHYFLYVLIGTALMVGQLQSLVQLSTIYISDSYATYAQQVEGGGETTVLFLVSQGIFLYWVRPQNTEDSRKYNYLFSIYIIGLVPAISSIIASVNPSGILRLHIYFSHTALLLWPIALKHTKDARQRLLLFIGIILIATLFFYMTTSTFSKLSPYTVRA